MPPIWPPIALSSINSWNVATVSTTICATCDSNSAPENILKPILRPCRCHWKMRRRWCLLKLISSQSRKCAVRVDLVPLLPLEGLSEAGVSKVRKYILWRDFDVLRGNRRRASRHRAWHGEKRNHWEARARRRGDAHPIARRDAAGCEHAVGRARTIYIRQSRFRRSTDAGARGLSRHQFSSARAARQKRCGSRGVRTDERRQGHLSHHPRGFFSAQWHYPDCWRRIFLTE